MDILWGGVKDMSEQNILRAAEMMIGAKRVAVLTGAGISAESGVPTFRGKDGLWKQYRAESLATPEAFERDPALVWEWYDWRRGIVSKVSPNRGHSVLAEWERLFPHLTLITQNVDGLHEKAGSTKIIELHGNIWKLRCTRENTISLDLNAPLPKIPPICPVCQSILRPHIVWFGESLDPEVISEAFRLCGEAEVVLVVGTSSVVYPAAALPGAASEAGAKIIEINPDPTPLTSAADISLRGKAGEILPLLDIRLRNELPGALLEVDPDKPNGKDDRS
jgi:NAD-dependent deacetylase